ncbi:DUF72 domain-containing protein [Candidatus Parcubacteria bacterium]|nr:DUF72 domain-containing protein [Candidatus Parcubacteria bacterium]
MLYIGTSGWAYKHWNDIFYPTGLPDKDRLKYFSQQFKTAEVNYSFYRLPSPQTYSNWHQQTPKGFLFSLKASRYITHVKRLKNVKDAWQQFVKNALNLKEKLGPILFQFPASFKATAENKTRLEDFLKFAKGAFEFRHESWADKEIYCLLEKYNSAWVIADSPSYPKIEAVTADFVYLREHGSQVLFTSKYTKEELKKLAGKIKKWLKTNKDVYVYFNNDAQGRAVSNAKELIKLCE